MSGLCEGMGRVGRGSCCDICVSFVWRGEGSRVHLRPSQFGCDVLCWGWGREGVMVRRFDLICAKCARIGNMRTVSSYQRDSICVGVMCVVDNPFRVILRGFLSCVGLLGEEMEHLCDVTLSSYRPRPFPASAGVVPQMATRGAVCPAFLLHLQIQIVA